MHCFSSVSPFLRAWVRHLARSNTFIELGATKHFAFSWTVRSLCIFFLTLWNEVCVHLGSPWRFIFKSPVGAGKAGRCLATLVTEIIARHQTQRLMLIPLSCFPL